ncbi:glycosyltransferase family 1 protein [Mangrovimonas sp. TPBH4]|uniref:glycosyltransferase family 4 protein n=1 Tax=Mangrovimonas sp. TPBH4 TaxID=1645914 RepID=UPI0006B5FC9F|nr:glycosyltransferase family 1 protein [Mangrovimonas sp. TPBH4]
MNQIVNFIFRAELPQYNSIEELFKALIPVIGQKRGVQISKLPSAGASLKGIGQNLKGVSLNKTEIVHITGDVHYMALVTGNKTVLTIHDVRSIVKGPWLKQQIVKLFWFWLPALCVKKITVISEFSKEELKKVIPFAASKIQVVYNPVNSQLCYTPKKLDVRKPQILLLGTKPNKNLERTLEALKELDCTLLIIGLLSESQISLLKAFDFEYKNEFYVPYQDIVNAYTKSDLVLFASTYEGFGMPIIEAQAIGRPVITSNMGAMKEVAGAGACLVDPYSVNSIREGVKKVLGEEAYRQNLIVSGLENVKRFQLDVIAEQYLALYQSL